MKYKSIYIYYIQLQNIFDLFAWALVVFGACDVHNVFINSSAFVEALWLQHVLLQASPLQLRADAFSHVAEQFCCFFSCLLNTLSLH
jgi:hypothetical protein